MVASTVADKTMYQKEESADTKPEYEHRSRYFTMRGKEVWRSRFFWHHLKKQYFLLDNA